MSSADPAARAISFADVEAAARRLAGVVHRTPVVTSRTLDAHVGRPVVAKAENLQRAGSFKIRGAYNHIAALDDDVRRRGVVAYSSGNHAQAVALAARLLGTTATIVMPADAPPAKLAATAGYGAEIVTYDRASGDRVAIARAIADDRGLAVVPPFDDPLVMAGQGTLALELVEDVRDLAALVVPVGGGGLISGCATAVRGLLDGVVVVGAEPEGADDTRRSLDAGRRITIAHPETIADGLLARTPGERTFPVVRELVAEVATVSDDEIVAAIGFAIDRLKLVLEPSGAVALAALLAGKVHAPGDGPVGVVLSGGNVGAARLAQLLARAPAVPTIPPP